MRTLTRPLFTATLYDERVYTQERQLIYFERTSGSATTVVLKQATSSEVGAIIAKYTLDSNGKAVIDVTDYIRTYQPSYLAIAHGMNAAIFSQTVAGLINPANMIIPPFSLLAGPQGIIYIIPPQRLIEPIAGRLQIGFVGSPTNAADAYVYKAPIGYADGVVMTDGVQLNATSGTFYIARRYDVLGRYRFDRLENYNLEPLKCEVQYAMVRWVSCTGATRVHTMMVAKNTTSVQGVFDLLNIENQYTQIKGREESCKIYIDNLSAYDFWYYADIIASSKVEISFDGSTFYRAEVTSNSVTIPDSDCFDGKLEIDVNWRKYDAVAL